MPSVATALADEHLEVRQSAYALLQALQAGAREGHLATRLVAWILSAGGYSALSRFGGDNPEAGDGVLLSGTRRAGTQVGLALVHVADVYGESVLDDVVEGLVEWWEQELRQEETRTDQTSVTEEAAERRAAECVANCVEPLLPALLLPLSQTPNSAARASERLEKLLLALPMSALTKVVVRVTGCMIRAFSDADAVARMAASCSGWAEPCGRAALLGTLHELVVRAGGGVLRVFVPQLTSIYVRALGDTHGEHALLRIFKPVFDETRRADSDFGLGVIVWAVTGLCVPALLLCLSSLARSLAWLEEIKEKRSAN